MVMRFHPKFYFIILSIFLPLAIPCRDLWVPSLNSPDVEFGFVVGMSGSPRASGTPYVQGISFGAGGTCRLNDLFFLRSGVLFTFSEHKYQNAFVQTQTFEFPVHLLFRPIQRPYVKPALVTGVSYKTRLGLFYDVGLRLEIRLTYFTLSPSWIFSFEHFSKNEQLLIHYGLLHFDG